MPSAIIKHNLRVIGRINPSGNDFSVGDFTANGEWNELDLSAIIPFNTKGIFFHLAIMDDSLGASAQLRANNINSEFTLYTTTIDVINQGSFLSGFLPLYRPPKIDYWFSDLTWTLITLNIIACLR